MVVSKHARKRMKERCKLPARAHQRAAARAWLQGVSLADADEDQAALMHLVVDAGSGRTARLHNGFLWVFAGPDWESMELVTVLPLWGRP